MKRLAAVFVLFCLLLVSCAGQKTNANNPPIEAGNLTPYQTATATATVTPTALDIPTATLAPTITPTPSVYVVRANDTLIVIAYRNGLTLAELEAANPEVNAYNLTIGMKLNIPAPKGNQGTQAVPTPTPAAVNIQTPRCIPSLTGGLNCFAMVENQQSVDLENLTAEFRLTDPTSGDVISQPAQIPLNRLRAEGELPFYAYFPPTVFKNPQVAIQLLSASVVGASSLNYVPLTIVDSQIALASDGMSAMISGNARLEGEGWSAKQINFAAVAFDADGQVIGVRRLEVSSEIQTGESFPFTLSIYSAGGKIANVEIYGEGLP